ncbi:MAG: hypothetical protein ACK49R_12205, partial [Planctomycetota bacterium]
PRLGDDSRYVRESKMNINTLTRSKPSATDILAVLRDEHRHQCECDPEADPDIDLSFDSTIQDWRYACDLVEWKPLAIALNEQWSIDVPLSIWKPLLNPPKKQRLEGVCKLIAEHATIERVVVPSILGRRCVPAGVFFAVRELLERDGADVADFRPSSQLSSYSTDHFRALAGPVSHLAPGLLPAIKIEHPDYDRASCALIICVFGLFVSLFAVKWAPFVWIPFLFGSVFCWFWTWQAARNTKPAAVTFGDLKTIRDVCTTLAPGIRT